MSIPGSKQLYLFCAIVVLGVTLAGCSSGAQNNPGQTASSESRTATVSITAAGYSPAAVGILAGGVVTWLNKDTKDHQIRINNVDPASPAVKPNESIQNTFKTAGQYTYSDVANPKLTGTIVVK